MLLTLYKSALRPVEIKALLKLKIKGDAYMPPKATLAILAERLDDKTFCYAALGKVSRSFSAVIQQLPEKLKDAVCIFYLVLRALDTIEDDMSIPEEERISLLNSFYKLSNNESFKLDGIGDKKDYQVLLENYPKVYRVFKSLEPASQQTITDITKRMGEGMAMFATKDIESIEDYDLYCHFVAGLVGIGLTGLFETTGLETMSTINRDELSNSMGLFLQKTNIIRDYHEDLYSDRTFWPKEIWSRNASSLDELIYQPESEKSLGTLNLMITDALRHIPDCIEYLSQVKNEKVFRFTAVPQIMAIATLAKLYNNPKVLRGVVKVRKGLAAKVMMYSFSMKDVLGYFQKGLNQIEKEGKRGAPFYDETQTQIDFIRKAMKNGA